MLSSLQLTGLLAMLPPLTFALGINCRGSGLCHLATWENKAPERITQILRDAVWQSSKPNETIYHSGDHIICVSSSLPVSLSPSGSAGVQAPEGPSVERSVSFSLSGKIEAGGICLFPQLPDSQPGIDLGRVRMLADKILEHGCKTCGSVPYNFLEGNNDPAPGILTFNYVKNPSCTGGCIGADGAASDPNQGAKSAKFRY